MSTLTTPSVSTSGFATLLPSQCAMDPSVPVPIFSNSFISGLLQALVVTACGLVISEIMGLMKNSPYRGILNMIVDGLLSNAAGQPISIESVGEPSRTRSGHPYSVPVPTVTTAFSPLRAEPSTTLLRQPVTVGTYKSTDLSDCEP